MYPQGSVPRILSRLNIEILNSLSTNTVDQLLRVALNHHLLDLDKSVHYFVATKQATFTTYINQREEYHKKKAESSDFKLFESKIVSIGNMPESDEEILINDMKDMN